MGQGIGRVSEVRLGSGGKIELSISCPASLIPSAGQFVLGLDASDLDEVIRTPLFRIEKSQREFWASPLYPVKWGPGTNLNLIGPVGHGFNLPHNIERLGMITLGNTIARLLPLVNQSTATQTNMTLFTDLKTPMLPTAVEVYPLALLKDTLDWPDYLVLDMPAELLPGLRGLLGLQDTDWLPCPAQVLVTTPMPCSGMAKCGACAVRGRRGWKLACEDGPVFDLNMLAW
jgi:hypothetical protein